GGAESIEEAPVFVCVQSAHCVHGNRVGRQPCRIHGSARIFRASALHWRTTADQVRTSTNAHRSRAQWRRGQHCQLRADRTGQRRPSGGIDVLVDERGAGLIRRGGGLVTMGSNADGGVGDPRRSLEDFAAELGFFEADPVDVDLCGRLWTACAGRARFAESVLRAAADAGVTVDPDSASFSDWVVGLCPRVSLSLGPGDEAAAAVLAQLSAVTETTALQALTAVADDLLGGLGISDPEGVIDRLRSSGVVTVVEDEVRGTLLKVPTLLAAKLRRDLDSAAGAGPVVASLLDVLVEHMESTGILEAELLGDVLLLARSGGH